jgi:uncharacterized protein YdaU (DUF1376 family)
MDKVRHIDFYQDEWLSGTASMDPVDVGVYITACALIYSHGGPIQESELKRFLKCHGRTLSAAVDRLVGAGKLTRNGSEISSKRCANELEKARKRIGKARENGGEGGRPRGKSSNSKDLKKPDGFFEENQEEKLLPTTNHQPKRDSESPDGDSRSKPRSVSPREADLRNEFEVHFWPAYPRRVGKQAALKQYVAARKKTDMQMLVDGAQRYAERMYGSDPHYIIHPERWLSKQRWLDEELQTKQPDGPWRDPGPPGPAPLPEEIWPDLKETRH